MSRRDPALSVEHIRRHAVEAIAPARGATRADLATNRTLELALTRLVEIIGEAAARVPDEARHRWPAVPWRSATAR